MPPANTRLLSGMERIWLAADRISPPFAIQLVIEARGGQLNPEQLKAVLPRLVEATPGMAMQLKGILGWTRWQPGPMPQITTVDARRWDGLSAKGASFLEEPLDPANPIELILASGDPFRLIIRGHHAVTDGRGLSRMADQLFRALRGEELLPISAGPLTDMELAARVAALPQEKKPRTGLSKPVPPNPPADRPAPTGTAHVFSTAVTWARARIPGRHDQPLARIIRALVAVSHRAADLPLRIAIPVDLRRYDSDLSSTANLTGILHLDLAGLPAGPDALQAIQERISASLPHAASVPLFAHKFRNVPLSWLAREGKKQATQHLKNNRYPISATLSNVGKVDLRSWSFKGFNASRAFFIPPGSPSMPLFLMFCGDEEGLELCISMPVGLADENRLLNLLADLRTDLLVDNLRDLGRKLQIRRS
jgi:hypothetical protein